MKANRISGLKGELNVRMRLRRCPFQHLHGTFRTVSVKIFIFAMLSLSLPNKIYLKLCALIFTPTFAEAYLLRAEEQFCSRNFEMAETLYDAAISSSKSHKFVNEEALANELAGHFFLETGRRNRSVHYFSQAFEKYNEWGAVAKANTLKEYLDESER